MSYYRRSSNSDGSSAVSCGCYLLIFAFNVLVGTWSVNYLLMQLLGKTIPVIGAILIALFAAEVTVPVAIIVWLLKAFGVM
ncbi:MAG: hypothetical protein WC677_07565 [Clostridia bacterium]